MMNLVFSPSSCIVLFILSSSLIPYSSAVDVLTDGQSITDGKSLISAGGIFELGFFSPGNSSYSYVGIWYHNISTQTVVWVANRANPLKQPGGSLAIGSDGNLIVFDGNGSMVWSTNTSSKLPSNSTAKLLDTGNLVLQASNGTVAWKSFDHPTHTFLPGMSITLDRKTGKNQLFTSWKSDDDPSAGSFSLGLDPLGSGQMFIWKGAMPWWRSGQWNKQSFIGTMMQALYLYGFMFNNDVAGGTMSFTFTPANSSQLRFTLQPDGVENTSMLVNKGWESVWVQPVNVCEIYGACGFNGACNISKLPICSCLQGFEPASNEEWTNGNWSRGCVRRTQLQCELNSSVAEGKGTDGFLIMQGVKVPDFSDWASTVLDAVGCEKFCLSNCSCKAYAFISGIGCLVWGPNLIDIYEFPQGGQDLYIKLAGSDLSNLSGGKSQVWKAIVAACVVGVVILIACIYLWWKCRSRRNWWKGRKQQNTLPSRFKDGEEAKIDISGPSEGGEEGQEAKDSDLPLFTLEAMAIATSNFSDENKLGQGGFGSVYKGILPGGAEVAIKRLSRHSGQGLEEFKSEMKLIAKLQHRNLVRLLGCCIQGEEKILIYEYMPNKSLDSFLFDPTKKALLDWQKRFDIIEGIARGLLYLHRDSRLRIVHRDLKASNVLLDEDMNPKISDFGMARTFGGNQNEERTNRPVGTYGYMSPEYAMEGVFSVKSDVYSFGVLILEIVMGTKTHSFRHLENSPSIVGYAWRMWSEGRAMELIDPSIRTTCSSRGQALRCMCIALLCVQDQASDRPDVSSIVHLLKSENEDLTTPKQPIFLLQREREAEATNDLTITELSSR